MAQRFGRVIFFDKYKFEGLCFLVKQPIYQRFLVVSNLSEIICALLCVTRSSLNQGEPAAADDDHDDRGGRLSSGLETRNRLLLYNTPAMPRTFFFFPLSTLLHSPPVAGGTCLRARRVVSVRAGVLVRTRSASTAPWVCLPSFLVGHSSLLRSIVPAPLYWSSAKHAKYKTSTTSKTEECFRGIWEN